MARYDESFFYTLQSIHCRCHVGMTPILLTFLNLALLFSSTNNYCNSHRKALQLLSSRPDEKIQLETVKSKFSASLFEAHICVSTLMCAIRRALTIYPHY